MAKKAKIERKKLSKTQSGRTETLQVVRGIGSLLTMAGAAQKGGRRILEEDLGEIRRAAMVIQNGRVRWVGTERELSPFLKAMASKTASLPKQIKEINLGGRTVLPAFIESHTHLVFAGNRADEFELRNQGATYQEIGARGGGILATVRPTRAASMSALAASAQARADVFVRQGVTTIEVKSGYALDRKGEFKMLKAAGEVVGPRIVRTYLGPHAIPPEAASAEAYIDQIIREDLIALKEEALACRVDIFVEQGYFPEPLARRYLSRARELGFDLVVHADQLTRAGGAQLAVEFGARSAEHLIRINEADVRALAASETTNVLLPAADLYLRCPYPPARALIDSGARVAIATDFNPGSSPTQSVSLVGVLARLEMRMTLPETLGAYTIGAAFALGLQQELGSLEAGKIADWISLDGEWRDLFYSIGDWPISDVWSEGRSLL